MSKGKIICSEADCFNPVDLEFDVEYSASGKPYKPSQKCWECRTAQDRKKIKRFRKIHNKKTLPLIK